MEQERENQRKGECTRRDVKEIEVKYREKVEKKSQPLVSKKFQSWLPRAPCIFFIELVTSSYLPYSHILRKRTGSWCWSKGSPHQPGQYVF